MASSSRPPGTHVISPAPGSRVVGNVLTHHQFRGRGYAKAVTGAVTAELLRTCDQVVLNVRSDNPPALHAYRRLGYQEHSASRSASSTASARRGPTCHRPLRRFFPRKEIDRP